MPVPRRTPASGIAPKPLRWTSSIILALLLIGLIQPVLANNVVLDEEFTEFEFTGGTRSNNFSVTDGLTNYPLDTIIFADITRHSDISYISLEIKNQNKLGSLEEGTSERIYTIGNHQATVYVHTQHIRNLLGEITSTIFHISPQNWNIEGLSGKQQMVISPALVPQYMGGYNAPGRWANDLAWPGNSSNDMTGGRKSGFAGGYSIVVASGNEWKNHLTVESTDNDRSYQINLKREYGEKSYFSQIDLKQDDVTVLSDYDHIDFRYTTIKSEINTINITSPFRTYSRLLGTSDTPGSNTLTVYIKNSQTGALIANANVVIDALVDDEYYPVTNRTEPSGIFTITLQPTGGGKPNPDGYRLIVTADGYNNPMPEINFTVDDYKNYIYCLLDPIAGGPVNENKTFIDFFVRDMASNPISGATVKFGKYTLITNSAGYTVFEVDKNSNYSWTVSKSGYGPLTGNAVIGDAPRHTINTVLAPIVTPTTTTPIPTSPSIDPTSTMTAPTGEPVSNWLEWFAAHFGMILGGGVEIGKIFMWLCFTVPVGVYVGKEAKAGAAGFMAGAGIVTLFFVLIGWVPIWLVVLLALIIGLLYAKEFNAPDNGGGR